jgi:hypothetical protein
MAGTHEALIISAYLLLAAAVAIRRGASTRPYFKVST